MDVSENSGTPKSSNLIGVSILNHPFWGTTIFGNTYIRHFKMSCNTPPVDDKGGQDCQRYLRSQVICIGDLTIHLGKKNKGDLQLEVWNVVTSKPWNWTLACLPNKTKMALPQNLL